MELLVPRDRVEEIVQNVGLTDFDLAGAVDASYMAFAAADIDGEFVPYCARHRSSGQWETGVGLYDETTNTLVRYSDFRNSNGLQAKIDFAAGVVDVWIDIIADKTPMYDADSDDIHFDGSGFFAEDLTVGDDLTVGGVTSFGGIAYTWPASQGANQYLKTNGSGALSWASILESISLGDLSDVTLSSPTTGQALIKTAGNWVNSSDGTALNVSASNLTTGTVPVARVAGSYTGITGLGTVTVGTWSATTIAVTVGGTGLTGYAIGDSLYASGTQTLAKLPIGTAAQYYRVNVGATAPEWHTLVPGDITNPAALTKADDTNVTLTLGGSPSVALLAATSITAGWTGTLAAARLNANTPQSIVNDTNVTGSIAAQVLTLGWTGTLAAARLNANVVQAITNDTNVTGSIAAQTLTLAWSGQLGVTRGGTSFSGYAIGDTIYASGTTTLAKLTIGAANTVMTSTGTAPQWVTNIAYAALPTGNGSWDTGVGTTITISRSMTVSGTLTGTLTGNITGNAATATALQTARAINGVNFDGTAAITITAAAGTLTGTTLNPTVVTSSLTTVGTLLQLDVANNITATRASGTSVDFLAVQTGVATWRIRNTATTGLFAIGDTTGSFFTLAPSTGVFAFSGAGTITGALTLTAGTVAVLTFGAHLTGTSFNSSTNVTIATDAASANTVSTIVARDGSGNFSAGTITATLSGSISGNAATATALQNARTIFGVSFDGTANVLGAASGFTTIAATGDFTITKASGATPAVVLVQTSVATWTIQNTATTGQFRVAQGAGTSLSIDLTTHAATFAGALAITGALTGATTIDSTSRYTITGNNNIGAPGSDGIGQLGSSTANGLLLIGRGSVTDFVLHNKNGLSVFTVATGTRAADFQGAITVATTTTSNGLVTSQVANAVGFDANSAGISKAGYSWTTNSAKRWEVVVPSGTGSMSWQATVALTEVMSLTSAGALTTASTIDAGGQTISITRASGNLTEFVLVQTSVATWRFRNTATTGLFALNDGTTNWFTVANSTGATTLAGAATLSSTLAVTGVAQFNAGAPAVIVSGSSNPSLRWSNNLSGPAADRSWEARINQSASGALEFGVSGTQAGNPGFPGVVTFFSTGGVNIGAPTGGDKGAGTINVAGDIYKNNTAYANPDYVFEYLFTGKIEVFAHNPGAADFKALTLPEVEEFARNTFQLPGISRALGIFERSDALLEAVESAYGYLFDHEHRIAALEARLA